MATGEDQDKAKKTISQEEWKEKLDKISISKQDMNKLIMNFFLIEEKVDPMFLENIFEKVVRGPMHEKTLIEMFLYKLYHLGYKDAAENFKKESGTEISNFDLNFMQQRIEIRSLIHNGSVQKAIEKVNLVDSKILENNDELLFHLNLQKLIELIKDNKTDDALDFAQNTLLPVAGKNPKFMELLEQVMSLLAFEDVSKSPLSFLVENSQRIKISSEVNYELLKTQSTEKESKLPTLLKLLLWSQSRLQEKLNFPTITNLTTGEFSNTKI